MKINKDIQRFIFFLIIFVLAFIPLILVHFLHICNNVFKELGYIFEIISMIFSSGTGDNLSSNLVFCGKNYLNKILIGISYLVYIIYLLILPIGFEEEKFYRNEGDINYKHIFKIYYKIIFYGFLLLILFYLLS